LGNTEKQTIATGIVNLFDNISALVQSYISLLKVELKDGTAKATSILIFFMCSIGLLAFLTLFISTAFAFWLVYYFSLPNYVGFLFLGTIHFILFVLFIYFRRPIRRKIQNFVELVIIESSERISEQKTGIE
jgi:uncharacterized membrane protein YqjE